MTDQAKSRRKGDISDDSLRITETSLCDNLDQDNGKLITRGSRPIFVGIKTLVHVPVSAACSAL